MMSLQLLISIRRQPVLSAALRTRDRPVWRLRGDNGVHLLADQLVVTQQRLVLCSGLFQRLVWIVEGNGVNTQIPACCAL